MKELAENGNIININTPTNKERVMAMRLTRDEFLGALMLNGAKKIRFSALKADLSN
jgi:hypothetical protein